jgi:hypothetical protein
MAAVFLLKILWCSQSDDRPESNFGKFGCIIDMKVEKKQYPSIFLATFWKLSWGSGYLEFF